MSGPFGSSSFFSGTTVAAAYTIDNSVWYDGTNDVMTYTPGSSADNLKVFTFSTWMKLGSDFTNEGNFYIAGTSGNDFERLSFRAVSSALRFAWDVTVGSVEKGKIYCTAIQRDPTAWSHYMVTKDAANTRVRFYINGIVQTATTVDVAVADVNGYINSSAVLQGVPGNTTLTDAFFDGYMAETVMLDGVEASPSDFGEFNSDGVWIPVNPTDLTFGTNGFWLDFEDSSDLGNDVSGNDNDFTTTSMSASNQTLDSPTDSGTTIGNYSTGSSIYTAPGGYASEVTWSEGNTKVVIAIASGDVFIPLTTTPILTGKWHIEFVMTTLGGSGHHRLGLTPTLSTFNPSASGYWNWFMKPSSGDGMTQLGGVEQSGSLTVVTAGQRVAVDIDLDNGTIAGSFDGSNIFTDSGMTLATGPYTLYFTNNGTTISNINAGQFGFDDTPATDHLPICTANLAAPTITKPTDQFLPILYEGNGAGQRVGNFIPFTDTFAVGASCRFDSGDSDFLSRTFDASDRKTWTFSTWVKRGKVDVNGHIFGTQPASGATTANSGVLIFGSANTLQFNAGGTTYLATDRLFLDTSSWHNIVLTWDTTDATAGDRVRIYYDGVELTNFSTDTNPALNFEGGVQTNVEHGIGQREPAGDIPYDGYLAETVFIDGTAYAASSFGETDTSTGRWIPKDVSGLTFGTNGTYLAYASENNLGDDTSGEGNDWAETNLDSTNGSNQMYDTPSQNFNVMDGGWDSTGISWIQPLAAGLTQGNLTYTQSSGNPSGPAFMGASTGKWYVEIGIDTMVVGANTMAFGIIDLNNLIADNSIYGENAFGYRNYDSAGGTTSGSTGQKNVRGDFTTFGTGYVSGDVFQIAMDLDAGHMWFAKNDTWMGSGDPSAGTNPAITGIFGGPNISKWAIALIFNASHSCTFNFGQWRYFDGATTTLDATAGGYFRYTPPTDFIAFQQDNLPANTAGITGFSWIKNRDATDNHILQTRVTGIYNYVESNTTDGQDTDTNSVQRFLQQGVQIGNMDAVNTSAESYVLWQWANDGAETSNGDGAITTTIRANTAAGFSMGTYTGDNAAVSSTIGHGLGVTPELVIVKPLERSSSWTLWHTSLSANKILQIDHNGAEVTPNAGYISAVSSTTITLAKNLNNNAVNLVEEYVFYAWFPVEGYSSFGSYVGNGDADGPFVCTGFRPSYLFQKKFSAVGSYTLVDNKRDPFNPLDDFLVVDDTDGTNTGATQDFLANGFKLRSTFQNTDTADYIYIAFAENPFGGSGVAQARAR